MTAVAPPVDGIKTGEEEVITKPDAAQTQLLNYVFKSMKRSADLFASDYTSPPELSDNSVGFMKNIKRKSEYAAIIKISDEAKRKKEAEHLALPEAPKMVAGGVVMNGDQPALAITYGSGKPVPKQGQLMTILPVGQNKDKSEENTTRAMLPSKAPMMMKPKWHAPWKLYRVISGHTGWVRAVDVEPQNKWFATGGADRIIKIWDLASGQLKLSLTGHISSVRAVKISDRHPFLFSGGEDKQLKCWDLETNKVVRHYHGHLSAIQALAVHPTLDILLSTSRDSTCRVWDMRTKAQVHCFAGHTNTVADVVCQSADPQVITASHDSTIRLWDLAAGRSMCTLTHHKKSVRALALHPRLFMFASASPDNIKQWKCPNGEFMQNLAGHNAIVNSLACNEDGVLVSGGDNGSMCFWDWRSGFCFQRIQSKPQPGSIDSEAGIYAMCFDKTGLRLITAEADKSIKMYKEDEEATEETHPIVAEELRNCLKVLSAAVSCSQSPVTSSKFDVVAELTKVFLARLSSCPEEWAQSIQDSDECSPSTSKGANDPRVRLGRILTEIYSQLSRCLRELKESGEDEYTFLSVQEQAQITATIEFYVLAQLLPYLDEGVGFPINKRSQYVKTWSRIDQDLEFKKIQIRQFLSTIRSLVESNATLKQATVRSILSDLISAGEQLLELGDRDLVWIERLLDEVPKREVIAVLISLSKSYDRQKPSPSWFTTAIGSRLSTVLRSPDGLFHFFGAYDEAGSGFWDNTHLLSKIAHQLARPPKSFKQMAYYEKTQEQFIALLKAKAFPESGMIQIYSAFIDSMAVKQPLAGEVFVLDTLLKPFEILLDSSRDSLPWSRTLTDAIWLLDLLSDDKIYPEILASSPRLVQLIPFFLSLLTSSSFDDEFVPTEIKLLSTKILKVLSFILPKVENASVLLFSFVVSTDSTCYQLVYKKSLVMVVGEEDDDTNLSIQRIPNGDREAVLMRKLDAVLKYITGLEKSAGSGLIIEILYESAKMWTSNSEQREGPRFVTLGSAVVESDWVRMAAHLVALFCFEQLGEWEVDPTNSYMLTALSKLITIILDKAVEWLQSQKVDAGFFDVSTSLPEEESRIVKVQQMSIQLAVGLAAAVVAAGTAESATVLSEIPASLARFVALASVDNELSEIVKDAQEVLQLLSLLGLKTNVQVQAVQVANKAPSIDFLEQLKLDLDDEMVPIRGEALLRVSKSLRRHDPKILSALDPWLYAKVKELVADQDSYVFLSAINALAEIALFDPKKYLNELLQLFLDQGHDEKTTDSALILRGNLAEVIGKVFRLLGDISPAWLDRAANIFLNALREDSDIIRASSLSAFSDLVASCRGRGLEKILSEVGCLIYQLFYFVETIIQTETSELVRRAAIHLVRQCIRSCDKDLLIILGDRLRDLRRELTQLWKWDKDHVVRLHAQLCLEEIGAGLKSALEDVHSPHLRVINIK